MIRLNQIFSKAWWLTAGADPVAGTSGNDTINALTVNAAGAAATTLSAFDSIDGGAGADTLNIYNDNTNNTSLPTSATVKNVETINIFNDGGTFHTGTPGTVDASKFAGATQVWQNNLAGNVSNLAATTTAGFKGIDNTTATKQTVTAATGVTSATVALDGAKGDSVAGGAVDNIFSLDVTGDAVNAVSVSGTLAQKDTASTAAAASLALGVTSGKDVETLTLNTAVKTTVSITEGTGSTKEIKTVDASASTGGITYAGTVAGGTVAPATIKTGSGDDDVTIVTATLKDDAATTAVDETRSALLETGAGKDTITINTSGTGTTTVNAGEGDDKVTLNADGSGVLTVNLGAGNDTFTASGAGAVSGTDVIDGGEGTDSLLLKLVGAANIGAFQNFEVFDAAALAKTLDVDILATKNTVTEFVASADVGVASLTNVGSGVNFRATGDMTTNALTLTQKTAGALTVTLDADSTSTTAENDTNLKAIASNATSLKAVFDADSGYVQNGANLNDQTITLTGTKATTLEVVSGGSEATNILSYTSGVSATAGKDLLDAITISGDKNLTVTVTESSVSQVTSINASELTGNLTISTAELKAESAANTFDGGLLTLGSGDDVITVTQGAKIAGIEKGTAEDAAAQSAFDVITSGSTVAQAADIAATATHTVKDGLWTFNGAGPATLAAAVAAIDVVLGDDVAVVFEYIGNSYVFIGDDTNAADEMVIQLTGVTGLTGLDNVTGTDNLYVF